MYQFPGDDTRGNQDGPMAAIVTTGFTLFILNVICTKNVLIYLYIYIYIITYIYIYMYHYILIYIITYIYILKSLTCWYSGLLVSHASVGVPDSL